MAKKEEKMGKVLPFPKRPKPAAKEPLEGDDEVRTYSKAACVTLLESFGKMPGSLPELLKLPDRLFLVGEGPSLSSDPKKDISEIAFALAAGREVTPEMLEDTPDYALQIFFRGSTNFCVMLDKSRKIVVMENLGNPLGGEPTWEHMASAIVDALKARDKREGRGERFSFLLNFEMAMRAV